MTQSSQKPADWTSLTVLQREACRLREIEGLSQEEAARRSNRSRSTIRRWETLPEWRSYCQHLRTEIHDAVVEAQKLTILMGNQQRVVLLRALTKRIKAEADRKEPDPDVLKKLSDAVDRLTTSAEDRGGYPKSERREHSGEIGVKRIEDMTDEELLAMAGD